MYSIDKRTKQITLTRGDSFYTTVGMRYKISKEPYTPVATDEIRFAVKKNYDDAEPLITKEIPYDTLILHLAPADTKDLPFGDYVYDIQLTDENGEVDTFIAGRKEKPLIFKLTEEVD